jgi:hypothetical protein
MNALGAYLQQFSRAGVTKSASRPCKATDVLGDFHLLRYLVLNDIIPFSMVR